MLDPLFIGTFKVAMHTCACAFSHQLIIVFCLQLLYHQLIDSIMLLVGTLHE